MIHRAVLWVQQVAVPFLGAPGLFIAALLDSSFLSLPEINDFLMITSCSARPDLSWLYVAMTTGGSIAGCSILWYVGRRGGEPFLVRKFGEARVARTRDAFRRFDVLALAIPAVMPPPMPFKIFVLSAGVFGFPYGRFVLTLAVARGLRYTFWGVMGIWYGERAIELLRRVEPWVAARLPWIAAFVLAGIVAALLLRAWRRSAEPAA